MKTFERILGIMFVIAIIMKLLLIPGGDILATLSLTFLSLFYLFLGFAFFNKIKLKNIFSQSSYKDISVLRIMGAIGAGWGFSAICNGILFKMMHWPDAGVYMLSGLIPIFVVAIIALFKFFRSKSDFYQTILTRIGIIGGICLFFLIG